MQHPNCLKHVKNVFGSVGNTFKTSFELGWESGNWSEIFILFSWQGNVLKVVNQRVEVPVIQGTLI